MEISCQLWTSRDFCTSQVKSNSESEVYTLKQEENQPQNPICWKSVCEILVYNQYKDKIFGVFMKPNIHTV